MLRQGFRQSFSPCVRGGEMLAFTNSRMDVLTGLGCGSSMCLFARKTNKMCKHRILKTYLFALKSVSDIIMFFTDITTLTWYEVLSFNLMLF